MNIARFVVLSAVTALILNTASALAALCESVESAAASTAYQKVDALLGAKTVTEHLQAAGLNREQALARVSQLSQTQLDQLVAQADLIQAGGTIQGDNNSGPIECIIKQLKTFFYGVYQLIFCWHDCK